jgi:hypothetical protein
MKPTAPELTTWLFFDTATRQDANGNRPRRGQRRTRNGQRMLVHSRRVLDLNMASDTWGICYQDNDKRVRGNDVILRLALAVLAFQAEGSTLEHACLMVVDQASVRERLGYSGLEKESNTVRVRVARYIARRTTDGISMKLELERMKEYWRTLHADQMLGTEWYEAYARWLACLPPDCTLRAR